MPPRTRPAPMSIVDRIEGWALAICRMDDLPLAAAADALGVSGPFEVNLYGGDHLQVVSPPPGIERLELTGRGGVLFTVRVSPSEGRVLVGDLEQRLGASWPVAHMPDSPYATVGFTVAEPGARHACTLFADVRYSPTPASSVVTVTLRRDPARPWHEIWPGGA